MTTIPGMSDNGDSSSNFLSFFKHVKYEYLVAGVSGGVASTLAVHPFDLLKIRLAVNDGVLSSRPQYRGFLHAVRTIFKEEGLVGFYRGISPNCFGAGASWGFYFYFYNAIKSQMASRSASPTLGPNQHMLAAAEAGVLTLTMTNPIWVIKTRMCLQYSNEPRRYPSMAQAFMKIFKQEGIAGLYKGFVPGIFGVSHGALQFMAYEEMKQYHAKYYNDVGMQKMGTLEYLAFAAVSKLFATTATYPYQVIRARLQDQHSHYNGIWNCIAKTWKYEGYRGFYKGLVPNLLRVTPATAITFVVYENIAKFLLK
ncbi:solute carrier family 25 member 32-like [Ornithodoros turicata]|uniref:Solute carrier family 25 member 32 n=1 Tax=Ornithodoros turicata TaxID=34597 RepID=A0A2R5L5F5_9ACAR